MGISEASKIVVDLRHVLKVQPQILKQNKRYLQIRGWVKTIVTFFLLSICELFGKQHHEVDAYGFNINASHSRFFLLLIFDLRIMSYDTVSCCF